MKNRFSISLHAKILSLLAGLLILAVAFYTLLASSIFRQEKIALLYEINHSVAVNASARIRSSLLQVRDQLRWSAFVQLRLIGKKIGSDDLPFLSVKILRKKKDEFIEFNSKENLAKEFLEGILPYLREAEKTGFVFWRAVRGEHSRFYAFTRVEAQGEKERDDLFVFAELDAKFFLPSFQSENIYRSYLVREGGEVVVHMERSQFLPSDEKVEHPLLTQAIRNKDRGHSGCLSFSFEGQKWYGAYSPVGIGNLFFLSQANQSEVYQAVWILVQRSVTFGLVVMTVTFLASLLFSRGLTKGLRLLTQRAHEAGKGELERPINLSSRDEVGVLAGAFNTMMEKLKASREQIEQYNRELEDKVRQRTEQLRKRTDEIKLAKEALVKASQLAAIGEVAGRTAHEVLNPLAAINLRFENLLHMIEGKDSPFHDIKFILEAWEKDLKEKGMGEFSRILSAPSSIRPEMTLFEEDLANLKLGLQFLDLQRGKVVEGIDFGRKGVARINSIVNGMRELSRASVFKETIQLYTAIRDALLTVSDVLEREGVALQGIFGFKQALVYCNRDEFIQILTNLIRNSIQAIKQLHQQVEKKQKGKIILRTANDAGSLFVDIIDNGIGIPKDRQPNLFEQGFTTKPTGEGTGLGLAICRRYARAFGGEVLLLYSHCEKHETCFRVTIPLIQAKEGETQKKVA